MDVLYRAFETTVTYLLLRDICKELNVESLTPTAKRYCSRLIMDQNNVMDETSRKNVERNLCQDNQVGKIWYTYAAHLDRYSAFFLIRVTLKLL